ncbi:MAG: hypothetical protein ACREIA_18840, partial [Opitutaceae bacterium]
RELLLVRRTEPDRDVAFLLERLGRALPAQPPPKIRQPVATPVSWRPLPLPGPLSTTYVRFLPQ